MAWLQFTEKRSNTAGGGFRISADQDSEEEIGLNCCSLNICRSPTRFTRITIKTFPCSTTSTLPPTYIYFKLFKWDSHAKDYLKASQTNMTLDEYRSFVLSMKNIDVKLDQMLAAAGVQMETPGEQQQQQPQPQQQAVPPPYKAIKMEASSTAEDDFVDSLTMADVRDIPY